MFESCSEVRSGCRVTTTSTARRTPKIQAFLEWILRVAARERWDRETPDAVQFTRPAAAKELGAWRSL